jgi:predicted RecB family nuclease
VQVKDFVPDKFVIPISARIFTSLSHYILSKTSYIKGLQCAKALFFYRHYPQYRDPVSPARQATFTRGHEVGDLARKLFPGGKDATAKVGAKSSKAVEKTKALMEAGENVIYEAAFVHEEVLVLVDILVRDGEFWKAYEVKSSLRLNRGYYQDAALQYFVLKGAGVPVKDFFLVHVNGYYVRKGPVDLKQLYRIAPVTKYAEERLPEIISKINEHKQVLGLKQAPDVAVGGKCFSPYECDFRGTCWKNMPSPNVFGLAGVSRDAQEILFQQGLVSLEQIPTETELPAMARLQVSTRKSGKPHLMPEKIREYLKPLKGEIFFLDIENFQPAVPRYDGTHPYMALPFAFSIHRREADGTLTYLPFMAEPGTDPRAEFVEKFIAVTKGDAPILAYDVSSEKTALNLLIKEFPNKAKELQQRHDRLYDLMLPFSQGWYHHPLMNGSISLKAVLPAIAPDMDYDNLAIQNGSHAMAVYERMDRTFDIFALAEHREALEAYCKMDTLGMVRIFEELERVGK